MTIRVEIAGKGVAEFPDGTPDAVIHDAVQRDFFGRSGGVAEAARARLATQGLTPEQVKTTDAGVAPAAPSMLDEFNMSGTGDAIVGALKGAAGVAGIPLSMEQIGQNPIANPAGAVVGMVRDAGRRLDKAGEDFANDPVRRGIQKTLAVTPAVGGMVSDLIQPSLVAPNREPTPEERQAAAGAAIQAGAMVGGPAAAKNLLGRGAGISEAATGQYTRGISTPETAPLAESIAPAMMRAGIKVGDAGAMAAKAGMASQEAALGASAQAAALDATPLPRGVNAPVRAAQRAGMASNLEALTNDAQFQANMQTVTQALADAGAKTPKNILLQGAKDIGTKSLYGEMGGRLLGAPPGVVTGVVSAVKGVGILRDLMKTPAWQTASALAKQQFGEALQTGNLATAGEIGAGIASGTLGTDAFGHRAAIQSLAAEIAPLPSVELKRQTIASKRAIYTDPSGAQVEIPRNVMAGFTDARNLTETNSPISLWIGAMAKQGKLKSGGTLEFVEQ